MHQEEVSQPREQHGFRRTQCTCAFCTAPCRHIPGSLDPSDLDRLCPPEQDVFAWAEQHLRAIPEKPFPTLVPARRPDGACHWHLGGACVVHEVAPYGCAFFDAHMTAEQIRRRTGATIKARQEDAAAGGLYSRVWRHLCRLGLTCPSGDRAALAEEMRRMCGNAERRARQLPTS
jgi:hypothetical protein